MWVFPPNTHPSTRHPAFPYTDLLHRSNPPPQTDLSYDLACKPLKAALDAGANFRNAGDFYGLPDGSLSLLNHYFTLYPGDADKVVPSIDNSEAGIRKALDNCLSILDGKKFIDLCEPARVDPKVSIEETIRVLAQYVPASKIDGIGLSECDASTIRKAYKVHPIANVEVENEPLLHGPTHQRRRCHMRGAQHPARADSPLSRGFLTGQLWRHEDMAEGDSRRHMPRCQPENFDANLRLAEEVEKVARRKGCSVPQVAIAWICALNEREKGRGEGRGGPSCQ